MSDQSTEKTQHWVGAMPPYRVDYIDPAICATSTPQWFVMGTVDGDPRNPQGPVAICEYEPSAHAIAYLLNETVDGHVVCPPAWERVEHQSLMNCSGNMHPGPLAECDVPGCGTTRDVASSPVTTGGARDA